MNGNFRLRLTVREHRRPETPPIRDPVCLGPFVRLGEQHENDTQHTEQQQYSRHDTRNGHVLLREVVEHPDSDRRGGIHHERQETAPPVAQCIAVQIQNTQHQERHRDRDGRQYMPFRNPDNGIVEFELRIAVHVVHAPVRPDGALLVGLPGLIEGFHDVVDDLFFFGALEETAQKERLVGIGRDRGLARAAPARPADFGDHDGLAGKGFLQAAELRERVVDRGFDTDALPVRQKVYADEVDMLGELRVCQPHVPRLRGADGLADGIARLIEVFLELLDGDIAAQDHLVTDDHPYDIDMSTGKLDRGIELGLVGVAVIVDPGADGHVDAVTLRELRNVGQCAEVTVGADRERFAFEALEILIDLRIGRHFLVGGILANAERRERKPLDPRRPRRLERRAIEKRPEREGEGREHCRDQQTG